MPCSISISYNQSKLQLSDRVEESLYEFVKDGYQPFFCDYSDGKLLLQNIPDGDHVLWYSFHRSKKKVVLSFFTDRPVLTLHVALQGAYQWKINNAEVLEMEQAEMNLIYLPYGASSLQINNSMEVSMFDIFISPFYLNQFTFNYPVLKPFIKKINSDKAVLLNSGAIKCSSNLLLQIQQLMGCKYRRGLRKLYFDARVMDIFLELFEQISGKNILPFILTSQEEERIFQISEYLKQNPHLHFTTRKLAKRAMINEFKLKKGFKQITGTSIFDFHFKVRMNKARELLSFSDLSLEEIAEQTGYEHVSSFIAAFKELNDSTPAVFRKMNKGL